MDKKKMIIFVVVICLLFPISCTLPNEEVDTIDSAENAVQTELSTEEVEEETPPQENTQQTEPPKKDPSIKPGEPPEPERTLADSDSSLRASEHRVLSGDIFRKNLYERPFTSQEMVYQPDLDIYTVDFAYDDEFFYFTINLNGVDEQTGELQGVYAIEFDRSLTGRGDLLVLVENLTKEWSINDVIVLVDKNSDVGGPRPIIADLGFLGSGYDEEFFLDGEQVAFARLSPENKDSVQIAVSRALLENPEKFLWGAWADNGLKDVGKFDYNDTMGLSEAGSPFISNADYPIDALYSVDNTCRLPYGFKQIDSFNPGICITIPPPPPPKCTLTCDEGYTLIDCTCVPWG